MAGLRPLRLLVASAAVAVSCLAPWPAVAQPKTLRFVAATDLKILDPTFTTAYVTRNFGYMVYDTLFAKNAAGQPVPQMVDKYTVSADGLQWSFTLRPGLRFSDGKPVSSADCVASLERWAQRDSMGKALTAAGAEWKVVDTGRFDLTLKQPFGLVLEALAKPSGLPPFILPERLARAPTDAPLSEVVESGPFLFKRDEWVPGSKIVFVRNPRYLPRTEPPSGLAGSKNPKVDRVEWLYLPDGNTALAALKKAEVDLLERVPPDQIEGLQGDRQVKVVRAGAWQGFLVLNHLHRPFSDARARRAVIHAISQEQSIAAMGYPQQLRVKHCASHFICGSDLETSAGGEPYRAVDLPAAKELLSQSGYRGEKVVVLVPTDSTELNGAALVVVQSLRSIGLNVEVQDMSLSSVFARRLKKDAPEQGGWSAFVTTAAEFDADSPVTNAWLSAPCGNSLPGWPCDAQLDKLRSAYANETIPERRRQLLDVFQRRAYETVPYISYGQYFPAMAAGAGIKNTELLWHGIANLWVLDK